MFLSGIKVELEPKTRLWFKIFFRKTCFKQWKGRGRPSCKVSFPCNLRFYKPFNDGKIWTKNV